MDLGGRTPVVEATLRTREDESGRLANHFVNSRSSVQVRVSAPLLTLGWRLIGPDSRIAHGT